MWQDEHQKRIHLGQRHHDTAIHGDCESRLKGNLELLIYEYDSV